MEFVFFISFIVLQRITELIIARRNEQWARAQGAIEYGHDHYSLIVIMHTVFLLSLVAEYLYRGIDTADLAFLFIYLVLIALKVWTISSLGKYWNTKILRIHSATLIKKGPYKYVKHPNYIIVICEIVVIPLVFHLYYTAILFSILNAFMLRIRIKEENKALV